MSIGTMILYVLVMALTTYIIRMIPFVFFKKKIESKFINSLLYYLPYAVLSAMTFPFIFYATGSFVPAMIGCVVAIIIACFSKSLILCASASVVAVLVATLLII